MSQYQVSPPFARGQCLGTTWVHPTEKTEPTVTGQSQAYVKKAFTDVNVRNGGILSNEIVTCVAVQNTTGAAVLPGTSQTVKGYVGVVDEYLPAAGAPDKEIYWLVVDGPTQQPLGTRVTLLASGTKVPRTVLRDGVEEPEEIYMGTDDATDGTDTTDPDATTPAPVTTGPVITAPTNVPVTFNP